MNATVTASPQQSCFLQDPEMFRNRGQRHVVRSGEVRDAPVALGKVGQDPATGRVGQRGEGAVQTSRLIFNHLVNC